MFHVLRFTFHDLMHIHSAWKHYFEHHHEGLGTTYERFLLHRIFERIAAKYTIQQVLEAPSFGMTGVSGINSLWWASEGSHVTIIDNNNERIDLMKGVWHELSFPAEIEYHSIESAAAMPFEDDTFDLAWNFAALWFVPNLARFLDELSHLSKQVILLCIPNRLNIFHRMRIKSLKHAEGVYVDNIDPAKITEIMRKLNWQMEEQGYFDIPPWPDIAMNKEDMLQKIGLKRFAGTLKQETDEKPLCILDYFNGNNQNMDKEILKYAFLEKSPRIFAKFWAHHQYLMFESR